MKIILKESQLDVLKLPGFIYDAISKKRTSIGDNEAIPPYGNFGFIYHSIKEKYTQIDSAINEMVENGDIESKDIDYLKTYLSSISTMCRRIEKPLRPQLQKLCENIVNKAFSTPPDTLILNCTITDRISPKHAVRTLPEGDNAEYDFEDVDEIEKMDKAVLKRRMINSLIQGFSYYMSRNVEEWNETVSKLDERLIELWGKINLIEDYLLFVEEEKITDKNPMQGSYVEVHLGKKGRKTKIDAQGLLFPYLLKETFRGLFELFSSHGLPEDAKKAMYIIRKADFVVAEPWDLRLGMCFVDRLNDVLTNKYETGIFTNTNELPFFFSEISSLKTDNFNSYMKNVLSGTNKGKILSDEIENTIVHDFEYNAFKDKITQKNIDTTVISDGCFDADELDKYTINEND